MAQDTGSEKIKEKMQTVNYSSQKYLGLLYSIWLADGFWFVIVNYYYFALLNEPNEVIYVTQHSEHSHNVITTVTNGIGRTTIHTNQHWQNNQNVGHFLLNTANKHKNMIVSVFPKGRSWILCPASYPTYKALLGQ